MVYIGGDWVNLSLSHIWLFPGNHHQRLDVHLTCLKSSSRPVRIWHADQLWIATCVLPIHEFGNFLKKTRPQHLAKFSIEDCWRTVAELTKHISSIRHC